MRVILLSVLTNLLKVPLNLGLQVKCSRLGDSIFARKSVTGNGFSDIDFLYDVEIFAVIKVIVMQIKN